MDYTADHNHSLQESVYQIKKENFRYIPSKGRYVNTPFRVEEILEENNETTGKKCLETFIAKGGLFHHLDPNKVNEQDKFVLLPGDIVYPSCSAGYNRSQTLHVILSHFSKFITLLPPHATRLGLDPFNDQVNWHKNVEKEKEADEFIQWANQKKTLRFGYDYFNDLLDNKNPPPETLEKIRQYFDDHYFGPTSIGNDQKDSRRVYITFSQNAHVILHRLNQTNEDLSKVMVVSIDIDDYIDKPFDQNVERQSQAAYTIFAQILLGLIDFSHLQ